MEFTRSPIWCAVALLALTPESARGQTPAPPEIPAVGEAPAAEEPPPGETAAEPAAETPPGEEAATGEAEPTALEIKPERAEQVWRDIVVVPRKTFLKNRRWELLPSWGANINDPLIGHFVIGLEVNHFLSDVLSVGVGAQKYFKNVKDVDFDVRRTYRLSASKNAYDWGANLNFGYVPAYGKFAVLNRRVFHWEGFLVGGIGVVHTSVIPRDPTNEGFGTTNIAPNLGLGGRIFLNRFLTLNFQLRDHLFNDQFEPVNREQLERDGADIDVIRDNADKRFVHNIVFTIGASLFFPRDFKYTTLR